LGLGPIGIGPEALARDLQAWVAKHPQRHDPRAFLFPASTGTAYRVGNFLKRVLRQKPRSGNRARDMAL
jgi:hypothetical protein